MTELGEVLEEIGLSHYLETFIEHGFDTWEAFADITESDFDVIGVKLGHRRKIQRKIANARGISSYQPLVSPAPNTPSDDRHSEESRSTITKLEPKESGTVTTGKRKYRRHPKPDENAPERPPSAYVIFSNKMRDDLKGRHLSFTEIAKLVGENWQALSPDEKEPFEAKAFTAKEKYNAEMTEYKKTDDFKKYMVYLTEFKEKHPSQQQAGDVSKRPKLVNENSGGSSGMDSSAASYHGSEETMGHRRVGSAGSIGQTWYGGEQHSGLPNLNMAHGAPGAARNPGSPATRSPNFLPGYRETFVSNNQQTLAWRDNTGDADFSQQQQQQLPRIMNMGDRRSGRLGTGPTNFDIHHTSSSFVSPPTLLASESTSGTTNSSTSNTSSIFYPRTPIEPSIDRSLPISGQMYTANSKPPPPYDTQTQLPPLRTSSSLSPKNSNYKSPTNIPSIADLSAPRSYVPLAQPSIVALPSFNGDRDRSLSNEEETLDPVSALLRADEIVSRQGPRR